jgi:site-specific DNA recombinase
VTETKSLGRCAIYTRKSSEEGLDQSFNSLHAQREACEAYVLSQKHEGWQALPDPYDDGGFSGGNMARPGLKKLLEDISAGKVDTVVVYKVDRLTRSLADFAKIVESFDSKGVSFVSVTQQFNTTSSMGRLTLNVLLSFAQFEREVTGERIRDKIAASKKKGMWMGGPIPLGYDLANHHLIVNEQEADTVRMIFNRYLQLKTVTDLQEELQRTGTLSKQRVTASGKEIGGTVLCRGTLYHLLSNPVYIGKTRHKGVLHEGKHDGLLDMQVWEQTAELLKENAVTRRTRSNLSSGRMLQGKLATEDGKFYTPTHSAKGGRRYFYYTVTGVAGPKPKSNIHRLPAAEIETRVLSSITSFLSDSLRVVEQFPVIAVRDTQVLTTAAHHRSALLAEGTSKEKTTLINRIVSRIVVASTELRIAIDRPGLVRELLNADAELDEGGEIELREPYQLVRRGSEVRLILASKEQQRSEPVPTVVRAVAQAKSWYQWIVKGEIRTMRELATRTGFNENYVSRILDLAVLSPQITEALLKGHHRPTLTVLQLTTNVEMDWRQQALQG